MTLDELIKKAREHKMTPEERMAQRRSFVRAEAGFGSDADEAAMRRALEAGDAEAVAALNVDAGIRMHFADSVLDEMYGAAK